MLEINHLSYAFEGHKVLEDITMSLHRGQTVAILGRSGVGKTTLFNLIASHLALQSGTIQIDGNSEIKGKVSYMLQKDLLLPHKTVVENIMLPLLIQKKPQKVAYERSLELLRQFNLDKWANYYPHTLSGGMRQRVAFLRTANFEREWVLLDEAFSALDAVTRRALHHWYLNYSTEMAWSTLLISHDVEEALLLADKIYVINGQPGTIVETVEVDLDKSNFEEVVFTQAFLALKRRLLKAI